jgi:hypothetical protein
MTEPETVAGLVAKWRADASKGGPDATVTLLRLAADELEAALTASPDLEAVARSIAYARLEQFGAFEANLLRRDILAALQQTAAITLGK